MSDDNVVFFDTTLRDGEQAPGFSMDVKEKLELAKQLEALGVDVIEAGFPIASEADAEAVKLISEDVRETTVAALARAAKGDIDRAGEARELTDRIASTGYREATFVALLRQHGIEMQGAGDTNVAGGDPH